MAGSVDLAKLVVKMEAQSAQYLKDLEKQKKATKKWQSKVTGNVKKVSGAFKGLAAAAGVAVLTKKIIENTKKQEMATAQLAQGYKSVGGVMGQTVDGMIQKAAELQKVSIFGDEQIIEAQSQLVTFTQITGEQFDRVTVAALDLSTRMGTDLKSSVVQLGKALNDPVLGLSALSRSGIQFNDQQKDLIKTLVESGDTIGAQKIILQELETQFGGSAAAARDTFGGALVGLSGAFNDLLEGGGAGGGLNGTKESIEELTTMLQDPQFVENTQRFLNAAITGFTTLGGLVGKVVEGWGKIYDWTKAGFEMRQSETPELDNKRNRLKGLREMANKPFIWDSHRADLNQKIEILEKEIAAEEELIRLRNIKPPAPVSTMGPIVISKGNDTVDPEAAAWSNQLSFEQGQAKIDYDREQKEWETQLYLEQLEAKAAYDEEFAEREIEVAQDLQARKMGLASDALGFIAANAKEGSALQRAALIASKAFAVAQILIETNVAAAKARAAYVYPLGEAPAASIMMMGYASAALTAATAIASFEGGGYTGNGPRAGGMDGKGGMMALVHPQESIIDHTKGQGMGGVTVNLIEDASKAGQVSKTDTDEGTRIDIAVASLLDRGNNRTTRALESRYPNNRRQGA